MPCQFVFLSPAPFQLHRELRLRNVKATDGGNYTCAVIKGYDGIAERYADTSEASTSASLWTVFGAEGNEQRAKIILDSSTMFPENLSTLVVAEVKTIRLRVRTVPPPVSEFSVRPSTIIAVLIWAYPPQNLSFYHVRSFTAEFRRHPASENDSEIWERLDPINIAPNIVSSSRRGRVGGVSRPKLISDILLKQLQRQLEVYHLKPNETYDFQIWANNYLGPGKISIVSGTTKSQYEEQGEWQWQWKSSLFPTAAVSYCSSPSLCLTLLPCRPNPNDHEGRQEL